MKNSMKSKKCLIVFAVIGCIYTVMRAIAKNTQEDDSINDDNPYTIHSSRDHKKKSFYATAVKPILAHILSFIVLVALSPIYAIIAIAIKIDDPGPVFFSQKRVGKDNKFFMCHKFRTMKTSAPHNVPTHQLENPEQYITMVGKFLRNTSMDEFPQFWDVFRNRMVIVGPRPALWNQDDLVAEREKYGANDVMPGITGLAQIRGRDELEIPDKARIDGEYVKNLSFILDAKCFLGTITSVLMRDGVVEGGTGALRKIETPTAEEAGFDDYGCFKTFDIDKDAPKTVLITGAGSYIGESFKAYCEKHYPNITVSTLDMLSSGWREDKVWDKEIDSVFHVAGIAHADVGKVSEAEQEKYYEVNTDLAIECCSKSKETGVKQFIFMSSMIIYGGKEFIDEKTVPQPANFYGNSKWLADKGVRELGSKDFKVAVLRPPMIYGKGSKGNYPMLSRIVKNAPVFPKADNKRSMLYIENLCEFVGQLALSGEGGIYFPQNKTYSDTGELVRVIGEVSGNKVHISNLISAGVWLAKHAPVKKIKGLADKAFGNSYYSQTLSKYEGLEYAAVDLEESIRRTES